MSERASSGRTLTLAPVTPDRVARYAAAALDPNPVHTDERFARRIGLAGPIVHGMFVMGQFERLIRAFAPTHAVEALSVRFVQPVPVGSALSLQGRIAQVVPIESGRERTLLRLVASLDRSIICIGTATLAGPPLRL